MEVFRGSWSSFTDVRDSVITVGFFDGLHLGHRAILNRLVESARLQGLRSVVLTFDSHPRNVLSSNEPAVPLLTTIDEKLELLAETEIDLVLVAHFDQTLAQMTPSDFVQVILKGRIGMRKIVVGFNHGFGKQRAGDRETLIAMSKTLGFSVEVVNPARIGDMIVSSTALRQLVAEGRVGPVAEGLGRYYAVRGIVIHGFGRGKRLHWPTANLGNLRPEKLNPKDGIYAGLARVCGETHPAAISTGFNPTFSEGKHSVEAHLIGFDRDIYDEPIEISFVERIRSEKRFESEAELSAQIAEDVATVSNTLAARGLLRQVS